MATHPNSLKNLRLFKKGKSGNPAGKPKGTKSFSTVFKKFLAVDTGKAHPETGEILDYMGLSTLAVLKKAAIGDIPAIKLAIEKAEGSTPEGLIDNYDVSALSIEELATLSRLLSKIKSKE
jgi:hypothetical protein